MFVVTSRDFGDSGFNRVPVGIENEDRVPVPPLCKLTV